jgi:hypothetical protein
MSSSSARNHSFPPRCCSGGSSWHRWKTCGGWCVICDQSSVVLFTGPWILWGRRCQHFWAEIDDFLAALVDTTFLSRLFRYYFLVSAVPVLTCNPRGGSVGVPSTYATVEKMKNSPRTGLYFPFVPGVSYNVGRA